MGRSVIIKRIIGKIPSVFLAILLELFRAGVDIHINTELIYISIQNLLPI